MRTVGPNSSHRQRLVHDNGADSDIWEERHAHGADGPAMNGSSDFPAATFSAKPFTSKRFRQWWAGRVMNGIGGAEGVMEDWSDAEAKEEGKSDVGVGRAVVRQAGGAGRGHITESQSDGHTDGTQKMEALDEGDREAGSGGGGVAHAQHAPEQP